MKSEGNAHFPTTSWSRLRQLAGASEDTRMRIYGELYQIYWFPIFVRLRAERRYDPEAANDMVQEFFLYCMNERIFERANQDKGRFRDYIGAVLMNFTRNWDRRGRAKIRNPGFPFVNLDDEKEQLAEKIVSISKDPAQALEIAWARNVLMLMVAHLKEHCHENAQEVHFKIFERRAWLPFVEDCEPTPYDDLAREFKLRDWKEAANMFETIKRTCIRLLREIVESYERPEHIKLELKDVVAVLTT